MWYVAAPDASSTDAAHANPAAPRDCPQVDDTTVVLLFLHYPKGYGAASKKARKAAAAESAPAAQ